mmetsp:Transcript_10223/g.11968  ORF Transcript_10223/g.11968 Transcript_10223/m.11968 type:complete len:204 (+) Transcript_10223:289-900(+)
MDVRSTSRYQFSHTNIQKTAIISLWCMWCRSLLKSCNRRSSQSCKGVDCYLATMNYSPSLLLSFPKFWTRYTNATKKKGCFKKNASTVPIAVFFSEKTASFSGTLSFAFHEAISALPFSKSFATFPTSPFALFVTKWPVFASRTRRCGIPFISNVLDSFAFVTLSSPGRDIHGIFPKYSLNDFMSRSDEMNTISTSFGLQHFS